MKPDQIPYKPTPSEVVSLAYRYALGDGLSANGFEKIHHRRERWLRAALRDLLEADALINGRFVSLTPGTAGEATRRPPEGPKAEGGVTSEAFEVTNNEAQDDDGS